MRATATPWVFRFLQLAVAACAASAAGCASLNFDLKKNIPWGKDEEKQSSTRVVALWSDAVLNRADGPPVRGFGGRLMFYGNKSEKPMQVRGTLTVYAFDEEGRDPADTKPDRKFVITEEQFAKHYSKSKVGDSYSVWIPWDEVGGPRKELSLIVRFTGTDGSVVIGEQTKHILPGRPTAEAQARKAAAKPVDEKAESDVRQVSYESGMPQEPRGRTDRPRMRVTTTTIPVTPQFGRTCPVAEAPPRFTSQPAPTGEPAAAPPQNPASPGQSATMPGPAGASTRFSLPRSRPLGAPIARLERDRAPWPQSPAGPQFRSPQAPVEPNGTESGSPSPIAR